MKTRDRVYEFIVEYTKANLFPPTIKEICDHVGLKSTSSGFLHLKNLQAEEKIKFKDSSPRSITLIGFELVEKQNGKYVDNPVGHLQLIQCWNMEHDHSD